MSSDYTLFLRDKPDFERLRAAHDWLEKTEHGWRFAGFRVDVSPYAPSDHDLLRGQPWRDEIRWVVSIGGRHSNEAYNAFLAFEEDVAVQYRGASTYNDTGDLEWLWWDRDALAAQVRTWIASGAVAELREWFAATRGGDGAFPVQGRNGDGPREQVAKLVIDDVASLANLDETQELLEELTHAELSLGAKVQKKLVDAFLAGPASTAAVGKTQAMLRRGRSRAKENKTPVPKTVAELTALYELARADPKAQRTLQRGLERGGFVKAELGALLLERARAGDALPAWLVLPWPPWTGLPQLEAPPERATPESRAAFRARGSLAALIVDAWAKEEDYRRGLAEMVEQRRRAGETLAGVPDDVRALAVAGKRAEAVAEYARRYKLSEAVAQRVVDANI